MKSKRRLVHVLPLAAIVGASAIAVAGNVVINNYKKTSAADGISMAITGNLDFEITPEVGGTYAEKTIDVTVNTANANGYTLYMASKAEISNAIAAGEENGIVSVSETVAKTNMPINSWGYYIGGSNVSPIPASDSPDAIKVTDAPSDDSNKTTTVGIGVKVAPSLRSGNYGNTLSFSAVPNVPCEGIYCIATMQEMTPAVCDATTTPLATATEVTYTQTSDNTKIPRTILRDARDNKLYLVSKLADGKCWMSQNLALDLDSSVALTSDTTDLNTVSSWTPGNSTSTDINTFNLVYDYSLGEYGEYVDLYGAKSYRPADAYKYFVNGTTPSSTPSTNDGKSEWESAGNYYNWLAATAGHGAKLYEQYNSGDYPTPKALDSICPKGWRLPVTGEYEAYVDDARDLAYTYPYDTQWVGELYGFTEAKTIRNGNTNLNTDYPSNHDSAYNNYDKVRLHTAILADFYYESIYDLGVEDSFQYSSTNYLFDGIPVRCVAR